MPTDRRPPEWVSFYIPTFGEVLAKVPGGELPDSDFLVKQPAQITMTPEPVPGHPGKVVHRPHIEPHKALRLGLCESGLHIRRAHVAWWGKLREDAAAAADRAFSKLVEPTPGQIHRLNGGRGS